MNNASTWTFLDQSGNFVEKHSRNLDRSGRIWTNLDFSGLPNARSSAQGGKSAQIAPNFLFPPQSHSADGVRDCTTYMGSLRPLAGEMSCHWGGSKAVE